MKTTREETASRGGNMGMEGLKELYDQAHPLGALNEVELRRLRRRVRQTVLGRPARRRSFRLGTVVAALALLLLGGMGYAAADRLGWVINPWKAAPSILPEVGKTESVHPRRGTHVVKPSAPAPTVALPVVPDPGLPMESSPVPTTPANLPSVLPDSRPSIPVSTRRRAKLDLSSTSEVDRTPRPAIAREPSPVPESPVVAPVDEPKLDPASSSAGVSAAPSSEPGLLRVAMRKLRHENDPAGALALLSDVAKRFPSGALAGERSALEVEALLGLHREAEALSRLDGMNLGELPRSGERYVLRGELRARAHRHAEAAADFDRALSRVSGSPAWHERALWGRAVSRLHHQQRQQGIADLEDYLEQYPKGGHAAEANALLRTR